MMISLTWDQLPSWRLPVAGLKRLDVQSALWQERTLVKTWALRGTIHLFAAEDLPLIVAAPCSP